MARGAKMRELKVAALRLGVTSGVLRAQGWKTASEARVQAVEDERPGWLVEARDRRRRKLATIALPRQWSQTARRLGVSEGLVRSHGVGAQEVAGLLTDPPAWLVSERDRRAAHPAGEVAAQQRQDEIDEAYVRAVKDTGDTDSWAAGVLQTAGIHRIIGRDGVEVPVLPPLRRFGGP